jgi:catecholate siderophore receptor
MSGYSDAGICDQRQADVSRSTYYGSANPGDNDSGIQRADSSRPTKVDLSDSLQLRTTLSAIEP